MSEPSQRLRIVDNPDVVAAESWPVDDFVDLRGGADHPERGPEVIQGLVREGEVLLVGSSSKHGKSWLVGNLIWAAVQGEMWLGKEVRQGRVLLVDNELKRGELDWRHSMIVKEMKNGYTPKRGDLLTIRRRGKTCDIQAIDFQLRQLKEDWREFSLIVIDALYKTIPDGKSENDNEAMGKLMNILQGIAEDTGVPVVGVHHSPKGSQADKSPLDVFAGAGSFGRALDNAVVIRDHEQPELSVIDFVTRSNPPQPQVSAKFDWPIWTLVTAAPEVRRPSRQDAQRQEAEDKRAAEEMLNRMPVGQLIQQTKLFDSSGWGVSKCKKAVGRLISENKIKRRNRKKRGNAQRFVYYERVADD